MASSQPADVPPCRRGALRSKRWYATFARALQAPHLRARCRPHRSGPTATSRASLLSRSPCDPFLGSREIAAWRRRAAPRSAVDRRRRRGTGGSTPSRRRSSRSICSPPSCQSDGRSREGTIPCCASAASHERGSGQMSRRHGLHVRRGTNATATAPNFARPLSHPPTVRWRPKRERDERAPVHPMGHRHAREAARDGAARGSVRRRGPTAWRGMAWRGSGTREPDGVKRAPLQRSHEPMRGSRVRKTRLGRAHGASWVRGRGGRAPARRIMGWRKRRTRRANMRLR